MRSFGPVALVAISGVVLWKLFATLLFPLLGVVIGLVATTAKFALIVAVIFFLYSMIRRRREQAEA
jgi:cytochrome b subunit of formate dehydrogenase